MDWFVASDLLFYCLDFDLNIWFRVWNVTATFEKWAQGSKICIYHTLETPLSTRYKCFMLASFDQYMSTLHTCLLQTNKSIASHWATIHVNTHQVDLDQPVTVQLLKLGPPRQIWPLRLQENNNTCQVSWLWATQQLVWKQWVTQAKTLHSHWQMFLRKQNFH